MSNKANHIKLLKHNNSGFTLIEVMVAAVILFSVIATVSMVYRGAFLSSEKANKHIVISAVMPSVISNIQMDIRKKENKSKELLSGKSKAWEVDVQWKATLIEEKHPPKKYDAFTNKLSTAPIKYKLWQVQLTLEHNNSIKEYQYNELSWTHE